MREREGRGGGGGGGGGEGEEEKEKGAPPATIGGARFGAAEWQQVQIRDFDCGGPARAGRVTSWRTRESGGAELAQEEAAAAACIGRVAPPRQPPFAPAALVATTMAATRSSGHDGGGQDEQVAAQTNARLRANNKLATSREELEEGKGRGDEEPDQAGREREKQRRAASSASPTDASDDAPPPPLASAPASAPVVAETTKELEQLLQRRRSPEELGRPLQSGPRRAQLVDGPRERRRQQQQQQHSTSATLRRLLAHIDRGKCRPAPSSHLPALLIGLRLGQARRLAPPRPPLHLARVQRSPPPIVWAWPGVAVAATTVLPALSPVAAAAAATAAAAAPRQPAGARIARGRTLELPLRPVGAIVYSLSRLHPLVEQEQLIPRHLPASVAFSLFLFLDIFSLLSQLLTRANFLQNHSSCLPTVSFRIKLFRSHRSDKNNNNNNSSQHNRTSPRRAAANQRSSNPQAKAKARTRRTTVIQDDYGQFGCHQCA